MEAGAQLSIESQDGISTVVQALVDSWNLHDMTRYAAQFTEDADFVNVLGMHWQGRKQIEDTHAEVHRTIFRNSSLKALDTSLRALAPGIVLAHINWEMTGHETPPGAPFQAVRRGVITAVFLQQQGRWLLRAAHNTDTLSVKLPGQK
jgi:uncharacterized protein (TIGR02246 family)